MAKTPQLEELTVHYSIGMKVDLGEGQYENATFVVSRTETYDVHDWSQAEADFLYTERREAMQNELGAVAAGRYNDISERRDI